MLSWLIVVRVNNNVDKAELFYPETNTGMFQCICNVETFDLILAFCLILLFSFYFNEQLFLLLHKVPDLLCR